VGGFTHRAGAGDGLRYSRVRAKSKSRSRAAGRSARSTLSTSIRAVRFDLKTDRSVGYNFDSSFATSRDAGLVALFFWDEKQVFENEGKVPHER
jgi:hypothetical protein